MIQQLPHVMTDGQVNELNDRQLRSRLYDKKIIVIPKSSLDVKELSRRFGVIWNADDYMRTEENGVDKYGVASFDNKTDHKSLNSEIPWHHDIAWFEDIKYPIRILKAKSVTEQSPATQFVDASLLLDLVSPNERDELVLMDAQLINLWARAKNRVETKWIPLVQTHPHTKKLEVMLDSFTGEHLKYGANPRAGWLNDTRRRTDNFRRGVAYLSYLHFVLLSNVAPYVHRWQEDDIVIWDNQSGVMHYRTAITGKAAEQVRGFERVNIKHYWQTTS